MKTVGIIAEYNPFHTGHEYHIEETRKKTNADCVVIVMSGYFVQRGTPAIADKYTRAKSALIGGADLVIELPVMYSTGSAEIFAMGSVSILNRLGINYLSFGGESDNIELIDTIADILVNEPLEYSVILKAGLKKGLNLPTARKEALCKQFPDYDISSVIDTPNNILAIEYLKAIKHFKSNIKPFIIKRMGSGFHSEELTNVFASATALRECFDTEDFDNISKFMPDEVYKLYRSIHCSSMPIFPEDMDMLLYHALISKQHQLEEFWDVNSNLSNKIINYLKSGEILNFNKFVLSLKSKELTYTRISRALLHILLEIRTQDFEAIKSADYPCYGRILGFNAAGRSFLNSARKETGIPLISNLSDTNVKLNELQRYLLDKDIFASNIYRNTVNSKFRTQLKDEFRTHPLSI